MSSRGHIFFHRVMAMAEAEFAEERSGFGLPNLGAFVFFGLLLILLIVLLMPATGGSGGSPHRAMCQNNQHEIWTAVQIFESRKQRYPGWRATMADRQVSWPVQLMPYLGMNDQYGVWITTGSQPRIPYIPLYVCPSDEQETRDGPWLSYVVNCGLPDTLTGDELVETKSNGLFFDNVVTDSNPEPIFTSAAAVQKKDGLSQTLGMGENLRALGWTGYAPGTETVQEYLVGFNWLYYAKPPAEHWLQYPVNQRDEKDELITSTATSSNAARLNSRHANVAVVTFADGHSVFLNEKIDQQVYNKLCTPDGSYQIRADWPVQEKLDLAEYMK